MRERQKGKRRNGKWLRDNDIKHKDRKTERKKKGQWNERKRYTERQEKKKRKI